MLMLRWVCCGLLDLAIAAEEGTRLGLRVLEPEDKVVSSAKFNIKFGFQHAECNHL